MNPPRMKIGPMLRKMLPPTLELKAANIYRAIFVDLDKVAAKLAEALPDNANVLDIGGGDGELLNRLLKLRGDVRVTMVDVAATVGRFLDQGVRSRVDLVPGTTIQEHLTTLECKYEAAIVVDVVHHIDPDERPGFLLAVAEALMPRGVILVKDVEPGHFRAELGYLCDRYISGDRNVELVSATQLLAMADNLLPDFVAAEIGLFEIDRPNYLIRIASAEACVPCVH